jgi:biotin carboxyl carrier protein
MQYQYVVGEENLSVQIEKTGAGYTLTLNGQTYNLEADSLREGELRFTLNSQPHRAFVVAEGVQRWVHLNGRTFNFSVPQTEKKPRRGQAAGPKHDALTAQMPGVVRRVLISTGEAVEKGQTMLVLEAMKMEIKIAAPHAGKVEQLAVREGETVQRGQLLVELAE